MSSYSRYGVGDAALDYASTPVPTMTMTPMVMTPTVMTPTAVTTTMSPPFVGPTAATPIVVATDAPPTAADSASSISPLMALAAGVAVGYFLFRK